MTTLETRTHTDALTPVREALLARAHADAARRLAEADEDAAATLAEAQRQSRAIRDEARAQGEEDAAVVLAAERSRTRREARAVVLHARQEAYEELRRLVRQAAVALRDDPGYPALRARLAARALADAGPGATVRDLPDGGVVAEAPGRRAVYALADLAERAVDDLGADVEGLWTA